MIRLYKSTDALPLLTLFTQTVHTVSSAYYSPEEIEAWAPSHPKSEAEWNAYFAERYTLVDEQDGVVLGFGCLSAAGNTIDMLFTHHAFQSRGVGSAVIGALEEEAMRRGQREVFLTVSATAWRFYLHRGYDYHKSERKIYGNILFDCQILRKALPAFPPMRRNDRTLDTENAQELLRNGKYGFLTTCAINGYGYGIPINYALSGESIYFHCARNGFKLENIRRNNRVGFCVVGHEQVQATRYTTTYESVLIFGKINVVISDDERTQALELLLRKYCPEQSADWREHIRKSFDITLILRLDIEHCTGKRRK
ncbi:MAG: GNAT family N-acetyltransferase [Bacteroidales bacterium]|jgi:nitroimidazol reductase NimA-like FMN-containing flavoprotein (pyridoxamine 5'-phosphate oxidase superfamily)/GNAT superfamily N-acetyltransferase|nr:GNAT family N-acetyltransferase [Bacteroidales bacterium]